MVVMLAAALTAVVVYAIKALEVIYNKIKWEMTRVKDDIWLKEALENPQKFGGMPQNGRFRQVVGESKKVFDGCWEKKVVIVDNRNKTRMGMSVFWSFDPVEKKSKEWVVVNWEMTEKLAKRYRLDD